ncbi:MAG: hypothetical protein ABI570_04150 [Ilumatobacteraceae bacterium]
MSNLHRVDGDETSMSSDEFDDDQINFVAPIPPYERQWRHPSELRAENAPRITAPPVHREFRLVAIGSACISVLISLALLGVVSPGSTSVASQAQARGQYLSSDKAAFQMTAGSTSIEELRSVIPHFGDSSQPVLAMPHGEYFLSSANDLKENALIDVVEADGQSSTAQVVAIDQNFGIAWLRRLSFAAVYAAETDTTGPGTTVAKVAHGDLVWVVDSDITAAIIGLSTNDLATSKRLWPVDSPAGSKLSGLAVDDQGVAMGWCVFVDGAQWIIPISMLEKILSKIAITLTNE